MQALETIKKWDYHFDANSSGSSIFSLWWENFYYGVWDEFGDKEAYLNYPSYDRTEKLLLTEPNSKWFDNASTLAKEGPGEIITQSFIKSIQTLSTQKGEPGDKWNWGTFRKFSINHLANIPGFGSGNFSSGGTSAVINAVANGHGPSWRMVVQMGPEVKGYGVFPGGESGNPGSFFYNDMFSTWKDGKLNELLFLKSADEKSSRIKTTLKLSSK